MLSDEQVNWLWRVYRETGNKCLAFNEARESAVMFPDGITREQVRVVLSGQDPEFRPKILLFDIETRPMRLWAWGLFKTTINPDWVDDWGGILCWAGRWWGETETIGDSVHLSSEDDMVASLWKALDECHMAVAHNGDRFDIMWANWEAFFRGHPRPSPYKSVDTLKVCKKHFRQVQSKRMDVLNERLKNRRKIKHDGIPLWKLAATGNKKAQKEIYEYCQGDIDCLEDLTRDLLPWIPSWPAFYTGRVCTQCGSENLKEATTEYFTTASVFPVYRCGECGYLSRERKGSPNKNELVAVA